MLDVKSVTEALQIITDHFSDRQLEPETVPLEEAVGRIAAVSIYASEAIPGFDRSAVDGYAVLASDTFGASETLPAQLRLKGTVAMGSGEKLSLQAGEAIYVPTGGELPQSADALVMIEDTEDYHDGFIYINKAAAPGNHVVFKGDDIQVGSVAVVAGTRLRPQEIGAAAALGYTNIAVKRRIRVGIIATGDEIIPIDRQPSGSQVRDINSYALYAGLINWQAQPQIYGIIKDDFEQIRQAVVEALPHSDVVLISGGSSTGARDETARVIDSLGTPGVLIHGIAVKPGKPTIIGKIGDKAVFGLPGHPASAYLIFHVFGGHLFKVLNGENSGFTTAVHAIMACNYPSNHGREEYLPVKLSYVDGQPTAQPVFGKSGMISLLTAADGYVHIGRGSEGLNRGAAVEVRLF